MKLTQFISILCLSLAGLSCSKWLDLKPQDGIVRQNFWQTKEQVSAAVTGIYASMLTTATNSTTDRLAMAELFFIWGEGRGDMVTPGFAASVEERDIVNLNILSTNNFSNWRLLYQTINYCNTVIELAPAVRERDLTFTEPMLNQAVGEALAVRSLMYFYLVRVFRDAPMKLEATISDQDITPIPKTPADSILRQIEADLLQAEKWVPVTYGNVGFDKGRVTKGMVNALLADVYLWTDRYAECVAQCDKIISSGRYGLVTGRGAFFTENFFKGNSVENIFELQFDVQKLNPFFLMQSASTRRWGAAAHLMEEVYGIDLVNAVPIVDERGDGAALRPSDLTIWKYIGANSAGTTLRTLDQSFAHWIFYRFADVLLMKAEAINQLNQPLEASRIVKVIRNRATALDFGPVMDSTSKSGMEKFILEERQREFAFEGKRWFDVLRNAKRNNYQRLELLFEMAAISVPVDRQQAAFNKLRDRNSHYMPIFLYELQTNNRLEQNPFYK